MDDITKFKITISDLAKPECEQLRDTVYSQELAGSVDAVFSDSNGKPLETCAGGATAAFQEH